MADYENDPRLGGCLEECLTSIRDVLGISADEICIKEDFHLSKSIGNDQLENISGEIEAVLTNRLPSLSRNARRYLLTFLHDYDYNYDERRFTTDFTRNSLQKCIQELQAMIDSLAAFVAVWNNDRTVVEDFVRKFPSSKDKTGFGGSTLLHLAAKTNNLNLVRYLIENVGCSVNAINQQQTRQLRASFFSDDDILDAYFSEGETPLHTACSNGHVDVVKYLVEHGADCSIHNRAGETPIDQAKSHPKILQYLNERESHETLTTSVAAISIVDDDKYADDGRWEYNPFSDHRWFPFSGFEAKHLRKSLIIESNEKFNEECLLDVAKGVYGVSMVTFLRSGRNLNYKEGLAWVRFRGSSFTNFKCYSWWQIMFQKFPSAVVNNRSTRMKTLPTSIQHDFKVECHQWYFVDTNISQKFDDAMKTCRETLKLTLNSIKEVELSFDMKNFTLKNEDQTIIGFIRWIPKLVSNARSFKDKIIEIDDFDRIEEMEATPLTTSRFRQISG